ncbi:MAG: hypothetical protein HY866_13385 [Chloroflexi bacterium]|nr:hypothetical protein [Chloroflexota bacterium]
MSGIYDRLSAKLGNDDSDKPSGLSPLEIASLPDAQRQIMFGLLRDTSLVTEGLTAESVLREKFANIEDLTLVLADLTQNGWLIRLGDPPNVRYRVNLRHKRGSSIDINIWSSLSDHLGQPSRAEKKTGDEDTGESTSSFPALSDW